uniref:Uncharacterized protein n=1 Tax=Arundo donax TaxID=35708 RepID=A0A0A8ZUG3_ARUDO
MLEIELHSLGNSSQAMLYILLYIPKRLQNQQRPLDCQMDSAWICQSAK